MSEPNQPLTPRAAEAEIPALVEALQARTPARVLVGRAGPAYRTSTQLELRQDHAAAVDAVWAELDPERDFGREFMERWRPILVTTRAENKTHYLMRPDLGRRLNESARVALADCPAGADLKIIIGDGLSAAAVIAQVPRLLPLLEQGAQARGWTWGRPLVVHYCRVGILNDIGDMLQPRVAVLLIGERPGLATAESLSAYMAFRPRAGHTDAQRNLISNIHTRGISTEEAARRILALADKMRRMEQSGITVKEDGPPGLPLL
jgi:ethanolamine ammonia-lyase small subunit